MADEVINEAQSTAGVEAYLLDLILGEHYWLGVGEGRGIVGIVLSRAHDLVQGPFDLHGERALAAPQHGECVLTGSPLIACGVGAKVEAKADQLDDRGLASAARSDQDVESRVEIERQPVQKSLFYLKLY